MRYVSRIVVAGAAIVSLLGLPGAASASPYSDLVLSDTPTGYWRLGEGAPTTAVNEVAGGNDGAYLGSVTVGVPGAIVGDSDTAAHFGGNPDKIDIPNYPGISNASFSFECWAQHDGLSTGHQSPVTSRNDGPQEGYIFYGQGGTWQFWSGPGWDNRNGGPLTVGQWDHLVGTYDAATQTKKFYVNGALKATGTGVTVNPNVSRPLRIGAGATEGGGNYWFQGAVDEVAVYDGVLAPDRVRAHYLQGTRGAHTFNLVEISRTDFANPGGVGLGPGASRMEFAGQTVASPTPTNPDGVLVLGGSGSGGLVFTDPLPAFDLADGPMVISTQAHFVNQDAPPSQDNAYMGLKALHLKGTSDTGAERRGGLWAQFQPYTTGSGHIRLGFQTDSTATGGDLWVDNLFEQTVSGFADANGPFDMELEIFGLEDADPLYFTVTQGTFVAEIGTTIGAYRSAVRGRDGAAGDALDLVLAELKTDPLSMNYGLMSTDTRDDGYNFLSVAAATQEIIPEPASMALIGLALAGLGGYARRRRRA